MLCAEQPIGIGDTVQYGGCKSSLRAAAATRRRNAVPHPEMHISNVNDAGSRAAVPQLRVEE